MKWVKLGLSIALTEVAGGIGAIATTSKISTWYQGLIKPSFNPPNWLFGPVWTILFLLMGIAFYLVWTSEKREKIVAMRVFGVQLVLNILWSFLFFGWERPGLALIEIVGLWAAIYLTIKAFLKVNKTAGRLLIPYLLWVSFASVLNGAIFWLNK